MRIISSPDSVINAKDRAIWLTPPFDKVFGDIRVSQAISLDHQVSVTRVRYYDFTQAVTLTQSSAISPKILNATNNINLSQSLSKYIIHNKSLTSSVNILQSLNLNGTYTKSLSQSIILSQSVIYAFGNLFQSIIQHIDLFQQPTRRLDIAGRIVYIPIVDYSLKPRKCVVILSCKDLNIVLPCPQFGDTEANVGQISLKRTMTGETYAYSKGSNLRKLSYRFLIERNKTYELLNFLKRYMSELITMINWKGETWLTFITNNPISLITKGLWRNCGEYVEVELQFEGTKISG
jgi:hypothetical protein